MPIALKLDLGLGFWPTFIALFALAIPPILTNTYVGVAGVDRDLVKPPVGWVWLTGRFCAAWRSGWRRR